MQPNLKKLIGILDQIPLSIIACSGGIDSLLLAFICHEFSKSPTIVVHTISPAVPFDDTLRVKQMAQSQNWDLHLIESGEFQDENYLKNPINRCFFCKSNLYASIATIFETFEEKGTIMSGTNLDDLGEYRPGLEAAKVFDVYHPWVEASIDKSMIRKIARLLDQPYAEKPSSPCLASRIYTGTRVTAERLDLIYECEKFLKTILGIKVVRCRIKESSMLIEVSEDDRILINADIIRKLQNIIRKQFDQLDSIKLDEFPYRPGRAFSELNE